MSVRIRLAFFSLIAYTIAFGQPISCGVIGVGLSRHFVWVNTETAEITIGPEVMLSNGFYSESSFFNPLTNQYVINSDELVNKYYTIDAETGSVVNITAASSEIYMPRIDPYTGLVYAIGSVGSDIQLVRINTTTGVVDASFVLPGIDQTGNAIPGIYDATNKHYILKAHSLSDPSNIDRYFIIDVLSGNIISSTQTSQHVDCFRIHPETGVIYGIWNDGGLYHFVSVDPWTAIVTIINTFDDFYPVSEVYDDAIVLDPINETYIFAGEGNFEDYYFTLNLADGSIESVAGGSTFAVHLQHIYSYSEIDQSEIKSQDISIYPNPMMNSATVFSADGFKDATLTISTLSGQIVRTINNLDGQTMSIERDDLAAGIYIISIKEDNATLWISKIVINN